jgi:hypothetical protein
MRTQRLCLALLFLLAGLPAFAQGKSTAAIRGTVTDQSGAIVTGAKVVLKGEDTGLSRSATTNAAGNYSFTELPVGSYAIEVTLAGFKSSTVKNVGISVAETRAVDVQLTTGDVAETLTVEASAVAVQLVGADVSGLVTGEQARELPLNGRNFMQLALLMPGVTATEGLNTRDKGLSGGSDVSVSGGTTTSNLWMVDGASNNDVGSNRTILVYPSVDAIEEFKIQRNNYGAEFGQAGGAQINLITRGGTNDFHGSGYWYARRDSLNSTDYFLKQAGQDKAPLKWDDFGGTFGGPIIKDKLHFFLSEEINKDHRSQVRSSFVPTQAERNGDFSGAPLRGCTGAVPIDPLTGLPFPGNRIPDNRISPAGKLLLQLYSLPNTTPSTGCNNWVQAVPTPVDWRQENARIDWTLTNSTRLMLRYTQDSWKSSNTTLWGDDPFPVVASDWNQPGKSLVAQLNQNIGSRMVNSLTFSYSANKIEVTRGGENPGLIDQINAALPTVFPSTIKEAGGASQPLDWGGGGYAALWNQAPWQNNQDLFVLKDDYSAVFGKHFFKAGILGSYNKKNEEPDNASQESVNFGGSTGFVGPNGYVPSLSTGNFLGDLLLRGTVYGTSEVQTNKSVQVRWMDFEGYLADSFKASPRVTIDFGVRLSHMTMPYMADDQYASFSPAAVNPAFGNSPCNGLLYPPGKNPCPALGLAGGQDGPNRSLQPTKALLIAPRLGVAWDVSGDGKMAIRAGIGQFYQRERVSPALGMGINPPLSGTASVTRTLDAAASVTGQTSLGYGSPGSGWEQVAANPYAWQWNVSFERELVRNTTLEVSYVGNAGRNLTGTTNLNQIATGDKNRNGVDDRVDYARTGDQTLRPLNGIAGIGDGNVGLWQHNRSSIYHALQAQLLTRFGRASQAQVSYTFSKAISNVAIDSADGGNGVSQVITYTDTANPNLERGRAGIDRTHVLSASLVLALPTFEGKDGFVKNVLGDWEFTSIVAASTGYPITVYLGNVPGLSGNGSASGTGQVNNQRPNVVAGQPCHVSGGNQLQWLNPAAYTINGFQLGTIGNSGRGVCDGPGFFQADMALYKNIKVGDRVKLQLRAEMFNVFNTVNFTGSSIVNTYNPGSVVFNTAQGSTASSIVSAAPAGNFGQLTAAKDPRLMQLGIRLTF